MARITTAFVLGAGLGTRLRPLTDRLPKPLLPVGGRPLITWAFDHCLSAGVERFIVNTHHCPAAYGEAFPEGRWRGRPILFRHEPVLLDTAGGLKNIEDLLTEPGPLLVYNGDILSDLPLAALRESHGAGGHEVTLALRGDGPLCNVALDAAGRVCDLRGLLGNPGVRRCQFTGISLVERRFLARLRAGEVLSTIPVLAAMVRERPGSVGGAVIDAGSWLDIGDRETYGRVRVAGLAPANAAAAAAGGRAAGADPEGGDAGGEAPDPGAEAAFVRAALGLPAETPLTFVPVGRGGSDRTYRRVDAGGRRALLMHYGRFYPENERWEAIAAFLEGAGIDVPVRYGSDAARRLILLEDLGDEDLYALRGTPWTRRRPLYEKTLRLAARLHALAPEGVPPGVALMPGFDAALYRWERDYFRERLVTGVCGIAPGEDEGEALEAELAASAAALLVVPPRLVHRDFQSQNVMLRAGEPVLIDFQGLRAGHPAYDLASLLWDPYVTFPAGARESLLAGYREAVGGPGDAAGFRRTVLAAAVQRLMQALGAYGFLGRVRGKPHFLAHIPRALSHLAAVAEAAALPRLRALVGRCQDVLADRGLPRPAMPEEDRP